MRDNELEGMSKGKVVCYQKQASSMYLVRGYSGMNPSLDNFNFFKYTNEIFTKLMKIY